MAPFWNEIYEESRSDSDSFDSIAYDLHVLKTRLLGFQAEVDRGGGDSTYERGGDAHRLA